MNNKNVIMGKILIAVMLCSVFAGIAGAEDWPMFLHDPEHTGETSDVVKNPETLELAWKFKTGDIIVHPSPAVSGNYVYVGSDDRYIYCLDKNTGEFKWKFKTREGVGSSPAVSGNYVYVGSSDGYVYAFTTPTSIVFAPTPLPEVTPMSTLTPGFEAVFAITGLLAVAHLLRRR